MKKILTLIISLFIIGLCSCKTESDSEGLKIQINYDQPVKSISPYIFGVNDRADLEIVHPKSIRLGGNRMTAYNWETNKSNAGADWYNQSDNYMTQSIRSHYRQCSGGPALNMADDALEHNIPYTLLTLQMAGYVANKDGEMTVDNALDSNDWCKIVNRKNGEFEIFPDTTDNVVYTDEYLNYLDYLIGKSDSETGIKAYALDNEPALWQHTHSLIQREPIKAEDLIAKSIDLAATVKDFDSGAEIFGPSLFGYSAYCSLGSDWSLLQIKSAYRYNWFIDYYLDKMKEAEETYGKRLLDVLDLHYYTEAKGACGKRTCEHFDNDDCIKARINAVRSLYDADYKEKSWIMDTGAKFFPLLPNIKKSIDTFYPGTKLGFTEYNFGGGKHISGAIAQSDFLGLLVQQEVYFASIWAFENSEYQFAAINMYTNYDSNGSYFGDKLVPLTSEDDYTVSAFAAKNEEDGKFHIILNNKNIHEKTTVKINLENSVSEIEMYTLDNSGPEIHKTEPVYSIKKGILTIELEPLTVNHLIIE
ncbi:MAG: glycoside hydrolase family 44 protein [Treponema sp.]|nr:glycoside hydrolase family 44 protein [Treponema sp.]